MDNQGNNVVVFDYTSFLGASCKKKWTLYEVFISIAPVFGTIWKDSVAKHKNVEDRLWEQAFNTLSAQSSDESNIIRLAKLAKDEGIKELKLMMPYELEQSQLDLICEKSEVEIKHSAQDEFTICL